MKRILAAALAALAAAPALAGGWQDQFKTVKFGVLSGENEKDRVQRYVALEAYLEKTLGTEVEMFTAGSYDGVIQALAANQIEFAFLGSSSYATAWAETEGKVLPLLTSLQNDGSTGYYSVIVTRCDSGLKSLADLKGKVLAFADPDSTSGYQVPLFNLVEKEGIDPAAYFSATPFSGSHEAGVVGVVNKQFDAAATYVNNEKNGIPQRMVAKGMIKEGEACVIWQSTEITSGPLTARANLPAELVADMKAAMIAFPTAEPAAFREMTGGDKSTQAGYVEVTHARYEWAVEMRAWLKKQRRGS